MNDSTNSTVQRPPKNKSCSVCGRVYPYTADYFAIKGKGVLRGYCKECYNIKKRKDEAQARAEHTREMQLLHDKGGSVTKHARDAAISRLVMQMQGRQLADEGDLLSELLPLFQGHKGIALQIMAHYAATQPGTDKHWRVLSTIIEMLNRQAKRNQAEREIKDLSEDECLEVYVQYQDRIDALRAQGKLPIKAESKPAGDV